MPPKKSPKKDPEFEDDVRLSRAVLQQMLNTVVDSGRMVQQQKQQLQPAAAAAPTPVGGVDRKVPDFWEARPAAWFYVFERKATGTSEAKFDALLAFLTTNALSQIDDIIDAPLQDPYDAAKKALLSHFTRNKLDRANDLRFITSLGDRTPSGLLRYMRSCQPGEPETSLFTVIFLNALPKNAKDAALNLDDPLLDDIATVADRILAVPDATTAGVSAVSAPFLWDDVAIYAVQSSSGRPGIPAKFSPDQINASFAPGISPLDPTLCTTHARFGANAYSCAAPSSCRLKDVLRKKGHKKTSASGNSNAGRQ